MELQVLCGNYSVCKLPAPPDCLPQGNLCFYSRTDREFSLVCESAFTPANCTIAENGWKALRVDGTLDFGLVGILSKLTGLLAEQQIPVFAVSTFDTDYLLVKEEYFPAALNAFEQGGYQIKLN